MVSPSDLPNPGIELGSSALQADSLPTERCGSFLYMFPAVSKEGRGGSVEVKATGRTRD